VDPTRHDSPAEAAPAAVLSGWTDVVPIARRAGDVIFHEGEQPAGLYQLLDGKVKIVRRSPNGRMCLLSLLGPLDVFGEDGLLDGGPRTASAVAITDVRAVMIDRQHLTAHLLSDPSAAEYLLRVMARRVRRTTDNITDLMSASVSARVAKHLLRLAQRFGAQHDGAVRLPLDLTQEQFAQLVGTSRESLNKTLGEFAESGWIRLDADAVMIIESAPLAQRMDGAPRFGPALPADCCRSAPNSAH
jgi:CRP/FNR family transcriptional regulator, cyclic AMP receptor protein